MNGTPHTPSFIIGAPMMNASVEREGTEARAGAAKGTMIGCPLTIRAG